MCRKGRTWAQEGLVRKEIRELALREMFRASWHKRGPEKLTNIETGMNLSPIHLSIHPPTHPSSNSRYSISKLKIGGSSNSSLQPGTQHRVLKIIATIKYPLKK